MESAVHEASGSSLAELLTSKPFILLEVYAPWCQHCRRFMPEYEKLAVELEAKYGSKRIQVLRYDGSRYPLPRHLDIEFFPSFFLSGYALDHDLFYKGKRTKEDLFKWVQQHIGEH